VLFLVIFISACARINPSEKIACEESGGTVSSSFSETYGEVYHCDCQEDYYEKDMVCQLVPESLKIKCEEISNEKWSCNHISYSDNLKESVCNCIFDKENSYLTYTTIEECNCECYSNSCGCDCSG